MLTRLRGETSLGFPIAIEMKHAAWSGVIFLCHIQLGVFQHGVGQEWDLSVCFDGEAQGSEEEEEEREFRAHAKDIIMFDHKIRV